MNKYKKILEYLNNIRNLLINEKFDKKDMKLSDIEKLEYDILRTINKAIKDNNFLLKYEMENNSTKKLEILKFIKLRSILD